MADQVTQTPKPLKIKKKGSYGISIFFASILITQLIFSIILHHNFDNQKFTLTTMGVFFFLEILLLFIIFSVFSTLRENPKGTFFSVWRYAVFIFFSILICSVPSLFVILGGNNSNLKDERSTKKYKHAINWSLTITSVIVFGFLALLPILGVLIGSKKLNIFAYDDVNSELGMFKNTQEEDFFDSTSTGKDNLEIYKVQLDIVKGNYDGSIKEWNELKKQVRGKGQTNQLTKNIKVKQKKILEATNPLLSESLLSSVLRKEKNGYYVTSDGKNYITPASGGPADRDGEKERNQAIENVNNNYQKAKEDYINKYSNSVYQNQLIGQGSTIFKFLFILVFCVLLGLLLHTEHTRDQLFKFNEENDIANVSRFFILGIMISSAVIFTLSSKNKFFFTINLTLYFVFLSLLIINRKNYGVIQVVLLLLIISFIFSEIIYDKLLKSNEITNYKEKIDKDFEKEEIKEQIEAEKSIQDMNSAEAAINEVETKAKEVEKAKEELNKYLTKQTKYNELLADITKAKADLGKAGTTSAQITSLNNKIILLERQIDANKKKEPNRDSNILPADITREKGKVNDANTNYTDAYKDYQKYKKSEPEIFKNLPEPKKT